RALRSRAVPGNPRAARPPPRSTLVPPPCLAAYTSCSRPPATLVDGAHVGHRAELEQQALERVEHAVAGVAHERRDLNQVVGAALEPAGLVVDHDDARGIEAEAVERGDVLEPVAVVQAGAAALLAVLARVD